MNLSLLPKRIKILCVSVLALLLSCEVQPTLSEKEIQQSILQDEDFVSMMADLFVMNYSEVTLDERDEHLKAFDNYFKILNNRYSDFHNNAMKAMGNKGELKYISFAENLNERISSANAKTAKYDAPSVCGQQSCGSVYRDNQALGCITGASYAEVYCLRNNMGNCSEMKNDIVQNCRDSFCSTY